MSKDYRLQYPIGMMFQLRIYVYYNDDRYGHHITYGSHDTGITTTEFMNLDFKELLFEKLL